VALTGFPAAGRIVSAVRQQGGSRGRTTSGRDTWYTCTTPSSREPGWWCAAESHPSKALCQTSSSDRPIGPGR